MINFNHTVVDEKMKSKGWLLIFSPHLLSFGFVPIAAEPRAIVSMEGLVTRLTTLYDGMTEYSAGIKAGDSKLDAPENLVFFGLVVGPRMVFF